MDHDIFPYFSNVVVPILATDGFDSTDIQPPKDLWAGVHPLFVPVAKTKYVGEESYSIIVIILKTNSAPGFLCCIKQNWEWRHQSIFFSVLLAEQRFHFSHSNTTLILICASVLHNMLSATVALNWLFILTVNHVQIFSLLKAGLIFWATAHNHRGAKLNQYCPKGYCHYCCRLSTFHFTLTFIKQAEFKLHAVDCRLTKPLLN